MPGKHGLTPAQRFFNSMVPLSCGCWVWVGAVRPDGYGAFGVGGRKGKRWLAHRWSYEHHRGPISPDLELDHVCKIKSCVNPAHLEAVTHKENVRRSERTIDQLTRTHCPSGHEYSVDNTYVNDGKRSCRICKRIRNRERYRFLAKGGM